MGWSLIENTLEVAISKQLNLEPYEGSLVAAGLIFKARCDLLRSLLHRDLDKNKMAINIVRQIQDHPERNAFVHGHMQYTDSRFIIDSHRTTTGLQIKRYEYSIDEFQSLALNIAELAEELRSLSISDRDVHDFFSTAYNRRQRSSTSP